VVEWSAWIHRPTAAELASYYPLPARRQGVKGMAVLACAVTADARVRGCHVLAERPAWEGFGAAALAMAKLFRIRPTLVDGKVYEKARVAIPVYFGTAAPEN
jgi:protein TonB